MVLRPQRKRLWLPEGLDPRGRLHPFSRGQRGHLMTPNGCGFLSYITNQATPGGTTFGTSITPGANDAMGSYTSIFTGATVTDDVYGVQICLSGFATSTAAKPALVDIGVDPAGGTSYTVKIPTLNASAARGWGQGFICGIWYYFPLFIKAGSQIAARAQVGNATAGTGRVWMKLFTKPTRPELLRVGTYIDAIGIDSANSRGTSITPGNTAEGSYTSIGTLPRDAWWLQGSLSVDQATLTALNYLTDFAVGDASNKLILIGDLMNTGDTSENWCQQQAQSFDCYHEMPAGATIYARSHCQGAPVTVISAMAYALGG